MRRGTIISSLLALCYAAPAEAAPDGFVEQIYRSQALSPATGAAWATDGSGRLFVLRKDGHIQVVQTTDGRPRTGLDGETLEVSTFATEPSVHTNSESGLLGLAFDPNYVVNRYLYVFVSVSASEQQVVRYTDVGGGIHEPGRGAQRTVVLRNLPSRGANHLGGGLAIGGDGKLYFSVGDLGDGSGVDADLVSLASKVGRANLDGTPVSDNPFTDGVGPNNEYIWARGLRNPFGLLRQPSTGMLWTTVAGTSYEQVFLLARRAHAGYDDYENNQPAINDYIAPKIVYRTNGIDTRNVTSAARAGGVLTVTCTGAHGFRVGQSITLTGLGHASFNGDVYVRSVSSPTSFTASQVGPDASAAAGGTATTQALGGAITRGTFYDATAFPGEYRGNFFFGDFNSGNLMRAVLSSANEVERVDVWSHGYSGNVQVTTGNDGSLYTLGYTSGILRRVSRVASAPALVLSNTNVDVPEGGRAAFTVALAAAPAANLSVSVARTSGDVDLVVVAGDSLTFTTADWQRPRTVVLSAANDVDLVVDVADFEVSAPGLATERVVAKSIEESGPDLVLSTESLSVPEGGQATLSVAWSARLNQTTTVTVARIQGDEDVGVVEPASLTFTSANWATPQTVTIAATHDDDAVAGRAQIGVASPQRARVVEAVEEEDDLPPPEPDAGLADSGTDDLDAAMPDPEPADAGIGDAAIPDTEEPRDAEGPDADELGDDEEPTPAPPSQDASTDPAEDDDEAAGRRGGGCQVNGRAYGGGLLWLALGLLIAGRQRRRRSP